MVSSRGIALLALGAVISAQIYLGLQQRDMLAGVPLWQIPAAGVLAAGLTGLAHQLLLRRLPRVLTGAAALSTLVGGTLAALRVDHAAAATGLTIALAVYFAVQLLLERSYERHEFKSALNRLTERLESQRAEMSRARTEQRALEAREGLGHRFVQWFQQFFSVENRLVDQARKRMMAAGYGSELSVMLYLFLRLVGPGVAGLAALPIALTRADGIEAQAAIVLFAVLLVYYAVEKAVSRQADGRKKAVVLEAPDVLDLLVIYTEAGQSLDNALQEVAVRGEKRYPVLCRELRTLLRELALLTSRKAAYDRFAIRCGADIIRRFVNVIQQAENVGAPISRTLRLLAADSRRDRLAEAERRAARIPILIQVPIVLFILPALFLILMGPVAIRVIETLAGTNF